MKNITALVIGFLFTSTAFSQTVTLYPLASNPKLISEKEIKELTELKETAKTKGLLVPSSEASKLMSLSIQTLLFADIDQDLGYLETDLQASFERTTEKAEDGWNKTHNGEGDQFTGIKLVGLTKTGFKAVFSADTTPAQIAKAVSHLEQRYSSANGGICGVFNKELEVKVICLNPNYQSSGEALTSEVKKITTSKKGSVTQAGGTVCTSSGCGTFKSVSVKQMDASSTRTVLTGKKVKVVQTRNYADKAVIPTLDQINIQDWL